jgi:hypothetical protein
VSALIAGKDAGAHDQRQAFMPGYVDPATGIFFPYEIGWTHLDKVVENESAHPGLGLTISYTALNITASVYVYSRNIKPFPEMFDLDFVSAEFDAAASDLPGFNSSVRSADDRALAVSRGGTSYLWRAFEIGAHQSVLALTTARRNYVKLRMTWLAEPLFDEVASEFIDAVFDLASSAPPN